MLGNEVINLNHAGAGFRRHGIKPGDILLVIIDNSVDFLSGRSNDSIKVIRSLTEGHSDLLQIFDRVFGTLGDFFAEFYQLVADNIKFIRQFIGIIGNKISISLKLFIDFGHAFGNIRRGIREIFILLCQRCLAQTGLR